MAVGTAFALFALTVGKSVTDISRIRSRTTVLAFSFAFAPFAALALVAFTLAFESIDGTLQRGDSSGHGLLVALLVVEVILGWITGRRTYPLS